MNFNKARSAMVESQIRPNGVRDVRILNAFAIIQREYFVPDDRQSLAYMDEATPVVISGQSAAGSNTNLHKRFLLPPMTLAKMINAAEPRAQDKVLDVGGVTGYSAAVLSMLVSDVTAVENDPQFVKIMQSNLEKMQINQVDIQTRLLPDGYQDKAPYDLIILNGCIHVEPEHLLRQLSENGRLIAIVAKSWQGHAYLYKKANGRVTSYATFDAGAATLPGFEKQPHFEF